MKKNLVFAALASLAFVACSKDDTPRVTPEMANSSYAKISISMPSTGTRAGWGDEFDAGSQAESDMQVGDIKLVLYDDNGFVVGSGEHIATALDESFSITPSLTGNISDENSVVFKLNLYEGAPLPTKVVAYINTDPMTFNLDELDNIGTNVATDYKNGVKFIMTSAGYYGEDGKYVIAAPIEGALYTNVSDATDAETPSANIYVERLAAKVRVDGAQNVVQDDQKFIIRDTEGKDVKAVFSANNFTWGITGTADKMYMLKKAFTYDAEKTSWMNGAGNNRSYWAEGAYWSTNYDEFNSVLGFLSFKELQGDKGIENGKSDYTMEHTYDYATLKSEPLFSASVPSTSTIILGTYTITNDSGNTVNYDEDGFYLLYTGAEKKDPADTDAVSVYTIYSKSELITYLKRGASTFYLENGGTASGAEDVVKVGTQFKLSIGGEHDLYFDNEQKQPVWATNARHYVGSQGYFFVPIEHYAAAGEENGRYGVVRNHSYVLEISSIQGLAAPLDDKYTGDGDGESEGEDEPIVPDPEDLKEAYIQASIQVLKWHTVSQNVKL